MTILLDTNAYTAWARKHPQTSELVRQAHQIHLPAVVVGELMLGFRLGTRFEANLQALDGFLSSPYVELNQVSRTTAERFAEIAARLRRKGTPIPTNDIWIAAHVQETGAELISFDGHFERVDGLRWVRPSP